jgi:preprotein translocase subunit SecF
MIVLVTLTTLASLTPMAAGTGSDTMFGAIALATAGGTIAGTLGVMFILPPVLMGWVSRRRRRANAAESASLLPEQS